MTLSAKCSFIFLALGLTVGFHAKVASQITQLVNGTLKNQQCKMKDYAVVCKLCERFETNTWHSSVNMTYQLHGSNGVVRFVIAHWLLYAATAPTSLGSSSQSHASRLSFLPLAEYVWPCIPLTFPSPASLLPGERGHWVIRRCATARSCSRSLDLDSPSRQGLPPRTNTRDRAKIFV